MDKKLIINGKEFNHECHNIDHKYILTGNVSKTEVSYFIKKLTRNIKDDDNIEALVGVGIMTKIHDECFNDDPFTKYVCSPFKDPILDAFTNETKINDEDMLWYIQNQNQEYVGGKIWLYNRIGLKEFLELEFNVGSKINAYRHLELDEYISKVTDRFNELQKLFTIYLEFKSRDFNNNHTIEINYE